MLVIRIVRPRYLKSTLSRASSLFPIKCSFTKDRWQKRQQGFSRKIHFSFDQQNTKLCCLHLFSTKLMMVACKTAHRVTPTHRYMYNNAVPRLSCKALILKAVIALPLYKAVDEVISWNRRRALLQCFSQKFAVAWPDFLGIHQRRHLPARLRKGLSTKSPAMDGSPRA